jgi:hypothetical protein
MDVLSYQLQLFWQGLMRSIGNEMEILLLLGAAVAVLLHRLLRNKRTLY